MASAVTSNTSWSAYLCPNWFAPIPPKPSSETETFSGDWALVTVHKRDANGQWKRDNTNPSQFANLDFVQELSSGDLYGTPSKQSSRFEIAIKASVMLAFSSFYGCAVMGTHVLRVLIDISSIFWRTLPQIIFALPKKGVIASFGDLFMGTTWELPHNLAKDIWRIVRSPFYVIGLTYACVFAVVSPLEGRKWLSRIQMDWHEASYRDQFYHGLSEEEIEREGFSGFFKQIAQGRVVFLGYCMLKRGNIHDQIAGKDRYEVVQTNKKETKVTS